jgi:thiamine transport system substrate-binding protein
MQLSHSSKILIAAVVLVIVALSYYSFTTFTQNHSSLPTLTIYTYSSLFADAQNVTQVNNTVFGGFERTYHVNLVVDRFSDTGSMLETLIQQKADPRADIVVGLTNLQVTQAVSHGVLLNYSPPNLGEVPKYLMNDLSPAHYLVPYEYSPITLDYCNQSAGFGSNLSFTELATPSLAKQLVLENPTVDSTGESFLLYEIAFYQEVLHENWETWWKEVKPYAEVAPDWGTAFSIFPTDGRNLAVSYGGDPAYFKVFGGYPGCSSAAMHYGGEAYTWLEIEGMGIVRGAKHVKLAEDFENWLLSPQVQSLIPEGEWVFPADTAVPLPPVFSAAIGANNTVVLNNLITPEQIAANLTVWLADWQSIMS